MVADLHRHSVTGALLYAAYLFPVNIWQIALVGMAGSFLAGAWPKKAVGARLRAFVIGEPEKFPRGRQWAAQLGMLTFAIGVLTQRLAHRRHRDVYSYLTAAAKCGKFSGPRLPYLYGSLVRKNPASAYAHACHDRDQHFGGRRGRLTASYSISLVRRHCRGASH